ncbi:MAG: hypothetical protein AAGA03_13280, partial [Planctomycetota bacterium]
LSHHRVAPCRCLQVRDSDALRPTIQKGAGLIYGSVAAMFVRGQVQGKMRGDLEPVVPPRSPRVPGAWGDS